ncbi:MAG TPA: ergothioneine biosynthesis glutamate--cysteine ligase EgtA [Pseudonocardiaceae bacterium]|nr:ergothioneine biosynthesis glutamate--cysteine ligase EgtA [Pseudonocardiaceae bacterium]
MTMLSDKPAEPMATVLHDRAAAETYVASVCFKHGPPRLLGVELEWTVHHVHDHTRYLDAQHLADALGAHAPTSLNPDSPHLPLPGGSLITVEPGGQVEISSTTSPSLSTLIATVSSDAALLRELLLASGLIMGARGIDQYRSPRRLLDTPRYAAMEAAFEPIGPDGIAMMCSTAGLQVCVDAGEGDRVAARWAAVHALGPVLTALFANSHQFRGPCASWASARLRTLLGTDPPRMRPPAVLTADPAASWARHVLDVPVICVRRPDGRWQPPIKVSFAEWIDGALPTRPTTEDLDYHVSTLFPPVRPRGYLEVRYLDAQQGEDWIAPTALLIGLLARESTVDDVLEITAPAANRWLHAARYGLADQRIATAARSVVDLADRVIADDTDLGPELTASVIKQLHQRIAGAPSGGERL